MKNLLKLISFIGLALTIIPSILVLFGSIENNLNKILMAIGAVLWFGSVPFWINKEKKGKLIL
jgi:hypothetical protein